MSVYVAGDDQEEIVDLVQDYDVASVAVHTIEREEAYAALRAQGWEPYREEEAEEKESP